jgi:hypothetical protein
MSSEVRGFELRERAKATASAKAGFVQFWVLSGEF